MGDGRIFRIYAWHFNAESTLRYLSSILLKKKKASPGSIALWQSHTEDKEIVCLKNAGIFTFGDPSRYRKMPVVGKGAGMGKVCELSR